MKPKSIRTSLLATLALSALSLGFAGCNKNDRNTVAANTNDAYQDTKDTVAAGADTVADKTSAMYQNSKDAVADTWNDIKDYSFDKSDDFKDRAEAMASDFDAKTSKLKADNADADASASRKAAWEKLKNDRADYDDKVDALGDATAATWDSAKANVITAWKQLQADWDGLQADHM